MTEPPTILVVEDEPIVRVTVTKVLTAAGYRVLSAETAQEAMTLCTEHRGPLHLALIDVMMRGQSGIELGDSLNKQFPAMPLIYMSGYTPAVIQERGWKISFGEFLQKPFTPAALLVRVEAIIGGGATDV